jgi:uncharacterized protein YpmS
LEKTGKFRFTKRQWLLLVDAAIMLVVTLVAIILLLYKPAEYKARPSSEEVSPYLTNRLIPAFYNGMQTRKPFELVIEEKPLNEAVSSFGWPQIHDNVIVSTPAISFSENAIQIISMVNYNGMDMVFSIEINPQFNEKGQLNLQIERAKIGALSVTFIVKQVAKRMFTEQVSTEEPDNIVYLAMASLMREEPFEPVFEMQNNKVKLDNIVIEKEKLRIHFVPVADFEKLNE